MKKGRSHAWSTHQSGRCVAFIGTGRMASALISAFVKMKVLNCEDIVATHRNSDRARELSKSLGVEVTTSNTAAVKRSSLIILCVRPQQVQSAMHDIKSCIQASHILISIAVGVPISWIRSCAPECGEIFHVHPSSLVMAGSLGLSFIAREENCSLENLSQVEDMFQTIGETYVVAEEMLDKYAVFAGASTAFFADMAIRWRRLASRSHIPRDLAEDIVTAMFFGLRGESEGDRPTLEEIVSKVATPKGISEVGLAKLESENIDGIFSSVFEHCLQKIQLIRSLYE